MVAAVRTFCKRGHDISILGRRKSGRCIACERMDDKRRCGRKRKRLMPISASDRSELMRMGLEGLDFVTISSALGVPANEALRLWKSVASPADRKERFRRRNNAYNLRYRSKDRGQVKHESPVGKPDHGDMFSGAVFADLSDDRDYGSFSKPASPLMEWRSGASSSAGW